MSKQTKSFSDFIKRTYSRKYQVVWTAILGRNESGKTDFALLQMEYIHKLGLGDAFGSNIPNLKADFEIDFIEDFQTLKKRCQMLNPSPKKHGLKRYFFLGDEMGDWAPRDQPWLNVKFIKELHQVRKYGLNFIGCAIDRVDERILNEKHFHGVFRKYKANKKFSNYYSWMTGRSTTIKGIRKTKIDFDTFYMANFYMEPQVPELSMVPLNPEHEIVIKYLECGNIKDTGIHRQELKRAIQKVLKYHVSHCLHALPQQVENSQPEQEGDSPKKEEPLPSHS